jgi:ketosteroid isomerase-like protein
MNEFKGVRGAILGMLLIAVTASVQAADGQKAAIEARDVEFSAALDKGDSHALAALYTSDGQILPQGSDAIKGNAAIQVFLQKYIIDAGVAGATLKTLEVFSADSTASEVGEYEMRNKAGVVIDHGKYMVVWRKVDGVWKIHRDMFATSVSLKKQG